MGPFSTSAALAVENDERRESPRETVGEVAELFIPGEDMTIPCVVANLSAGGAKIVCDVVPPSGSLVVLHFQGRSTAAVLVWNAEDEFGLRFGAPEEF